MTLAALKELGAPPEYVQNYLLDWQVGRLNIRIIIDRVSRHVCLCRPGTFELDDLYIWRADISWHCLGHAVPEGQGASSRSLLKWSVQPQVLIWELTVC